MTDGGDVKTFAQREAAYDAIVATNLRRNFTANFIHGMLGLTGFRLMYAPTLIPAYIFSLTGQQALVGLGQSLLQFGAILSPIIGASRLESAKRMLPYSIRVGGLMRVQIALLALAGWFLDGWVCAIVTLGLFFFLGVFTGMQRVAFQMLMSKVIPLKRRGRLQAWRNLTGGMIAAGLSYVAGSYLITHRVLGNGYATTFALSFVLTSFGLVVLQLLIREPDTLTVRPQMKLRERLRDFPAMLQDHDYRWFIVAQGLTVAGRIAQPFYILFAAQRMGLTGTTIGLLSLAFLGADTLSNLVWGNLGDRLGFRAAFVGCVALWIVSAILLLEAHGTWMIVTAFCGLGAASSGYQMSSATMVLEFGDRSDIPMRLALSTTVEGMIAAIGPLLGSLVAATLGYPPLLWLSIAFLLCALIVLIFRVKEPRHRVVEPVLADDLIP